MGDKQELTLKDTPSKRKPFSLRIAQWNGCSINTQSKTNFIRSLDSKIIAVQEIWQNSETVSKNFQVLDIVERTLKRGGGTATLLNNSPDLFIKEKHKINKDSNMLKINIRNNYIWLINIYLNQGKISQLQKLFGKIKK